VQRLIGNADPHLIFFPQRWPETYSYTLSEAFAAGTPILAPDIGAFAERLANIPGSWLYPVESTPSEVVAKLLNIRDGYLGGNPMPPGPERARHSDLPLQFDFYDNQYMRQRSPEVRHVIAPEWPQQREGVILA
jgi:glycosyltransferase involved in cell wall biosynthesis